MRGTSLVMAFLCVCSSVLADGTTTSQLQISDLKYLGAFRLPFRPPAGQTWKSTFSYGGWALAHNPTRNSLFLVGHVQQQMVAEVSIPTSLKRSSNITDLPTAQMLQPFADVTGGLRQQYETPTRSTNSGGTLIGGMLVQGNRLVWTVYVYYDAMARATVSHGYSSLNLADPDAQGIYALRDVPPGVVAGYMAQVPPDWTARLGYPALTGQAGIPIVSRTSAGPALVGFDPASLGDTPAPTTVFTYYPLKLPLAPLSETNQTWNLASKTAGMAFISRGGKSAVMVFGTRGEGVYWYGLPTYYGIIDTAYYSKGNHAPPYAASAWLYDPKDLLRVKNGGLNPWQVRPYNIVDLPNLYPSPMGRLGGIAYDAQSGRLYVSQVEVDKPSLYARLPIIHVYQVPDNLAPPTVPPKSMPAPLPWPPKMIPAPPAPSSLSGAPGPLAATPPLAPGS